MQPHQVGKVAQSGGISPLNPLYLSTSDFRWKDRPNSGGISHAQLVFFEIPVPEAGSMPSSAVSLRSADSRQGTATSSWRGCPTPRYLSAQVVPGEVQHNQVGEAAQIGRWDLSHSAGFRTVSTTLRARWSVFRCRAIPQLVRHSTSCRCSTSSGRPWRCRGHQDFLGPFRQRPPTKKAQGPRRRTEGQASQIGICHNQLGF